jgi:hypothetical protein
MSEPLAASRREAVASHRPPARAGRHRVLDERKQQLVLSVLAIASSRRLAAQYAGCSPSTIARTALRDPEFAENLARAEQESEINALRGIHHAAGRDKYWRAAARGLERKNPQGFGGRRGTLFDRAQVGRLFLQLLCELGAEIAEEQVEPLLAWIDRLLKQVLTDDELPGVRDKKRMAAAVVKRLCCETTPPPPGAEDVAAGNFATPSPLVGESCAADSEHKYISHADLRDGASP